ncbi:NAD(P)-binding protein [Sphingomonas colocasiae]|uniref:NAD(P)-binding protein n=1 Tax=Sphingomonas colocasiae TaxID=1848973 RepID=A0ABS7PMP0_9SPHN|nr:NAD(P)-binding protein [Sphingomonas colocasiae]MBY8822577.1 NAD(P)-binding protein [Sphingomonas colocasiae]
MSWRPSRRTLIAGAGAGVAAAGIGWGVTRDGTPQGTEGGADMARGHRLRDGGFPEPAHEEHTGIVIAGGGVAGLAAGWALAEAGHDDFRLLELEDDVGGNARGGRNAVSAYPLGAHYLPVANREAGALRRMLTQFGMITGEKDGAPVYDPYQLCADLEERLLWKGRWQEGLVPHSALSETDEADLAAFGAAMAAFSKRIGSDGKPAFALPIAYSSRDADLLALDRIGFADWLDAQGWRSPVLRAHLRYSCRDDYGCEPAQVSAWAGIHYFAGRRGWAADGAGENVLTWPEGNARLARAMAARFAPRIAPGRIVFRAARDADGVVIDSFDVARNASVRTRAAAAILAMPHFVAARIAPDVTAPARAFGYAPWLIANVTVDRHPAGRGAKLAWDNVSATSEALGYVVATHQTIGARRKETVLTWYLPLSNMEPAAARRLLVERPAEHWRRIVADDLLATNPDLEGAIRSIDLWRWGHAMIRPVPGFIWQAAPQAAAVTRPPFFLAHSDLSGLSLFEEAHYRGVLAAEDAMRFTGHTHETML